MQLGMVGLGRMGANMVRRLMRGGHQCVVNDVTQSSVDALIKEGASGSTSLEEFVKKLNAPRTVWLMLPLQVLPNTISQLTTLLSAGDVIIDGGNSFYKDDIKRAAALSQKGIHYVDVGTSGGVWGLERGYCLMIGGADAVVSRLDPIFKSLAPGMGEIERTPGRESLKSTAEHGYLHCGPTGSGHFVKMVHNGIEYALMQAYAEGFDLLRNAGRIEHGGEKFSFSARDISEVWRRGSVITSWLLDLTASALVEDPELKSFATKVDDTGEGRWTVDAAVEAAVPLAGIASSLFARFNSRDEECFSERIVNAMRKGFGGHATKAK